MKRILRWASRVDPMGPLLAIGMVVLLFGGNVTYN